jgi:hypothetical protein
LGAGLGPLSFETHLVSVFALHVFLIIFMPQRFAKGKPCSLGQCMMYGLGWLTGLTFTQFILALWIPPCSWSMGLAWWGLLTMIGTVFLIGLTYALLKRCSGAWSCRFWMLAAWILLSLPNFMDVLTSPTLWAYHFSLGYIPGPLYDAWIPQFTSLLWFRVWTLWLALFFMLNAKKFYPWTLLLWLPLFFRTDLGFRSTHASVERALGRVQHSQYARIFTHRDLRLPLTPVEKASLDHLIQNISQQLAVPLPQEPIRIYVYEDAVLKKKLTGTHWTMIGNPMQQALHMVDLSPSDPLLVHELSHVIAKPLGLAGLGLGRNMALTEGLAMAVQEEYRFVPLDQWAAYMLSQNQLPDLATLVSNVSFLGHNSAMSYTAAGSWIQWLIRTQGQKSFAAFYASGNAMEAFGVSLPLLEKQWHDHLLQISVDPALGDRMQPILARAPVFLRTCVHELSEFQYRYDYRCQTDACKQEAVSQARRCSSNSAWAQTRHVEYLLRDLPRHHDALASYLTHPLLPQTLNDRIHLALNRKPLIEQNGAAHWLWQNHPNWYRWYVRGMYHFMDEMPKDMPEQVKWSMIEKLHPLKDGPALIALDNKLDWTSGSPLSQTLLHRKMLRYFEHFGQPDQALAWLTARPPSSVIGEAWYAAQLHRLHEVLQDVQK